MIDHFSRPSRDDYFLDIALKVCTRGTCRRRRVGCVFVDASNNILSTGYNGPASGEPHCIDQPCPGAGIPSGQGLELCEAIHAEDNAIMRCRGDLHLIDTAYITASPCIGCMRKFLNTSCRRIVCLELYPHDHAVRLWQRHGREFLHVKSS